MCTNKIALFLITSSMVLAGCSSNVNTYQEPEGQRYATIKVDGSSFAGAVLGAAIMMPNNDISIISVDGKEVGFGLTNTYTKVTPGMHKLMFACTMNGATYSKALITINAVPGRTYTISYPSSMKGYTVDLEACKRLIVR